MNAPTIIAGALALTCAGIHGIVGDRAMRAIGDRALPANAFGGPRNSKTAVRVAWHYVTMTFAIAGVALIAAGVAESSEYASGIVVLAAALFTGFAVSTVGLIAVRSGFRGLRRHPAPWALSATAAFIWWGFAVA